jgi:predicted metal-dependent phosphotriesterase family hydrolase
LELIILSRNIDPLDNNIAETGKAQTVLGPVDPDSLGKTLMHEHLLLQTWIELEDKQCWINGGFGIPPETEEELAIWNAKLTSANIELLREPASRLRNRDANTISAEDIEPELLAFRAAGGSTVKSSHAVIR